MENLGKKAKDKITGFEGIITSKHIYLTGCNQYGIQPISKDGYTRPQLEYFDEGRLQIFEQVIKGSDVQAEENGCDFREHP